MFVQLTGFLSSPHYSYSSLTAPTQLSLNTHLTSPTHTNTVETTQHAGSNRQDSPVTGL